MRIMFFYFSCAFNTTQPVLSCKKLQKIQMDACTTTWIIDYLTNRPQFVRLKDCVCQQHKCTTRDYALIVSLHSVHIRLQVQLTCPHQKYSDDSAVVECINDGKEAEYRELVNPFFGMLWDQSPHLELKQNRKDDYGFLENQE